MKQIFLWTLISLLLISCERSKDEPLPTDPEILDLGVATENMLQADNEFGFDIFREVLENDTGANQFISPTSIAMALAMTYNGARGETKTAMENALRKQGFTVDEINAGYKSLLRALKSVDERVLIEIANSIWYKEGFTVLPEFININKETYGAEINKLDFASASAVDAINGWVDDKTHGRIPTIIDAISDDIVMYLINAIYFKGSWKYEFDKQKTTDGPFFPKEGDAVTVKYMNQTISAPLLETENFTMVEMPYGRGNFTMVILLPKEDYTTQDILLTLTSENWDLWMAGLTKREVDLRIPKFTYKYENLLNNELTNMGMGIAFEGADFSGINGTGGLSISRVLHKSFVEVNEEGTEAAAVTAVEIELTSFPPQNILFNVNRPFFFAIRESTTGAILFLGRVTNPLIQENGSLSK
jgi:serpin B